MPVWASNYGGMSQVWRNVDGANVPKFFPPVYLKRDRKGGGCCLLSSYISTWKWEKII